MQVDILDPLCGNRGNPVATFDFYDTLTLPEYDFINEIWIHGTEPNLPVVTELVRLASNDWDVIIITDTHKSPMSQRHIREFLDEFNIEVRGSIFTAGYAKTEAIQSCNSAIHYDDDLEEIIALADRNVTGILVPHPAAYMKEIDYFKMGQGLFESRLGKSPPT